MKFTVKIEENGPGYQGHKNDLATSFREQERQSVPPGKSVSYFVSKVLSVDSGHNNDRVQGVGEDDFGISVSDWCCRYRPIENQ